MRRGIFFFFFVVTFLLSVPFLLAADRPEQDGYWWASMTPAFKLGWVSGYAQAMDMAGIYAMGRCAAELPMYSEKYPAVDSKQLWQTLCSTDEFDYDGITMGQFVEGIDAFYKDYRNKQLSVTQAIEYARDEIKGKPAKDLETKLTQWRQCNAAYKSGDTEQMKKACSPEQPNASK